MKDVGGHACAYYSLLQVVLSCFTSCNLFVWHFQIEIWLAQQWRSLWVRMELFSLEGKSVPPVLARWLTEVISCHLLHRPITDTEQAHTLLGAAISPREETLVFVLSGHRLHPSPLISMLCSFCPALPASVGTWCLSSLFSYIWSVFLLLHPPTWEHILSVSCLWV